MDSSGIFSNRYVIHERLGSGVEGVIFRATDRLTAKNVAIKRVRLERDAQGSSRSSQLTNACRKILVAHEFQTLASLRHPNIISVSDYGFAMDEGKQIPYFVMDYLPEAETILEAGRLLSLEKKIELLIQMLQALHYLHQRGILHRDLKPANALVVDDRLKLLDFGLSAHLEKARGTSGTLPYMPPEYMQDEPLTATSDLYSVGIIGYEMLAGCHPFHVDDPTQLIRDILFTEPGFDDLAAPPGILYILEKLLSKASEDRYRNALDVITALSDALQQPAPQETEAIRESFLKQATFVGRETEMQQLRTGLDELLSDSIPSKGQAWLVAGESGVGKSRLLQEFRAQALVRGCRVMQGNSYSDTHTPYQLWQEPLKLLAVLTQLEDEQASVLKAIVPDIERVLLGMPFVVEPMPLEGKANESRMLAVLRALFQGLTLGEEPFVPLILILEDIQWAGSESLNLLRDFQESVIDLPVMIIASYHTDETPFLADELSNFKQLTLSRLSKAEVMALSNEMLGLADENLVDLLFRETEGNALFLVEFLRTLAEGTGRLIDIGKVSLPETVRAEKVETLLARRLEKVPDEARQSLAFAAVLGRNLDPALMQQNWVWPINWDQWLLMLSNAAIIRWTEGGRWEFAHETLRRVILDQLSQKHLKQLHMQAGEVIEAVYPDTIEYFGKVAFHWRIAENFEREFHYLKEAGEILFRTSAYREAIAMYERGLFLIDSGIVEEPPETRSNFLIKQGTAFANMGEYERSNKVFEEAISYCQEHPFEKGIAQGYHGLAKNYDNLGKYREAQHFYGLGLVIFEKIGDIKNAARIRTGLGRVAYRLGSFEEAKLAYQLSLQAFRELDEKAGMGGVLCGLGDIARVQGEYDLAKQFFLESQVMYQEVGNRDGVAIVFNNLGVLAETQGLYEEAIQWHKKSLAIKREIGARQGIAISLNNLGVVHYSMNDFETSRQYAEETAAIYKSLNDQQGLADSYNNLGLLDFNTENYARARERLSLALQLCEEIGDQWGVALVQLNLGKVARQLHANSVARVHFAEALELAKILKLESVALQTLIEHTPIMIGAKEYVLATTHLGHAFHNPKTPGYERSLAEVLLNELKFILSDEVYQEALEQGKSLSLDEILKELLLQFDRGKTLDT